MLYALCSEPNCEARKWNVLGELRVGVFAKKNIAAGTELTWDYNFQWCGGDKVRCHCGAPSCAGFLGAKSRAFQVLRPFFTTSALLASHLAVCWPILLSIRS